MAENAKLKEKLESIAVSDKCDDDSAPRRRGKGRNDLNHDEAFGKASRSAAVAILATTVDFIPSSPELTRAISVRARSLFTRCQSFVISSFPLPATHAREGSTGAEGSCRLVQPKDDEGDRNYSQEDRQPRHRPDGLSPPPNTHKKKKNNNNNSK